MLTYGQYLVFYAIFDVDIRYIFGYTFVYISYYC